MSTACSAATAGPDGRLGMFGSPDGRLGIDGTLGSDGIDGSDGTDGSFGIEGRPNRCTVAPGPSVGGPSVGAANTTDPSAARWATPARIAALPGSVPARVPAARTPDRRRRPGTGTGAARGGGRRLGAPAAIRAGGWPCWRPGAAPGPSAGSPQRIGTTSSTADRCTAGAAAAAGSAVAIGWSPSSGALRSGTAGHHGPGSAAPTVPGTQRRVRKGARGADGGVAGSRSGVGSTAGGMPVDICWTTGSSAAAGPVEPDAAGSPVLGPMAAGRASGPLAGSICTTGPASGGSGTRCCGGRVSGAPRPRRRGPASGGPLDDRVGWRGQRGAEADSSSSTDCPLSARGRTDASDASPHGTSGVELGDLLWRAAELGEDGIGVLAEAGREPMRGRLGVTDRISTPTSRTLPSAGWGSSATRPSRRGSASFMNTCRSARPVPPAATPTSVRTRDDATGAGGARNGAQPVGLRVVVADAVDPHRLDQRLAFVLLRGDDADPSRRGSGRGGRTGRRPSAADRAVPRRGLARRRADDVREVAPSSRSVAGSRPNCPRRCDHGGAARAGSRSRPASRCRGPRCADGGSGGLNCPAIS